MLEQKGGYSMASEFLEKILARQNRTVATKVVFVDVKSYSKRRSQTQAEVIDLFMVCLRNALKDTAQQYIEYAQQNGLNFQKDIISLPSGDGAAIIFPFEGLHDIHLFFALSLLKGVYEHNQTVNCTKFDEQGWCNCHSLFNLSIGVNDGKSIIYKDINDNYNVAGTIINMASRVMKFSDKNQIIFTEDAYKQIIDMVDNPHLDENFKEFLNIPVKHGLKLNLYQYIDDTSPFLNSHSPEEVDLSIRAMDAMKLLAPAFLAEEEFDIKKFVKFIEALSNFSKDLRPSTPLNLIQIKPED
jgi:hypothetical protein